MELTRYFFFEIMMNYLEVELVEYTLEGVQPKPSIVSAINRTPMRDALREYLGKREIGTAIYYPLGLHEQKCFAYLGYKKGDFPETERAASETLALPIYPEISREAQRHVVSAIAEFFS